MKVNFLQPLKTLDGEELKDPERDRVVTLGIVAVNALLALDDKASGIDKLMRWQLAERINNDGIATEITAEEIATIKERIGKAHPSPVIVGQALQMLEGQ